MGIGSVSLVPARCSSSRPQLAAAPPLRPITAAFQFLYILAPLSTMLPLCATALCCHCQQHVTLVSHIVPDAAGYCKAKRRDVATSQFTVLTGLLLCRGCQAVRSRSAVEAWCSGAVPYAALQVMHCCHTRLHASGPEVL